MCGRVSISLDYDNMIQIIKEDYEIEDLNLDFRLPRYNVGPGQNLISVISDGEKYRVGTLRWGFVPFWAKDEKIGYKMINAKAETLHEKKAFTPSFKQKRCVLLVDGFYEWKKEEKNKTPMRFILKDRHVFPLAGLWSSYTKEDGEKLYTCTIITTAPNDLMKPIHDRMPVILSKEQEKIWLNPKEQDLSFLSSILLPYESNKMEAYEVSNIVNSTKNERKECILPV